MIKNMEEKKAAKRKADEGEGSASVPSSSSSSAAAPAPATSLGGGETKGIRRAFKQRRLGGDNDGSKKIETVSSRPVQGKIKSVLGNVFGR